MTGQLDITYTFPAGTNNGKIASQMDNISGEQVTYQYDSLNRLASASAPTWSETYGFDGFGNLVSKTPTGGAPTLSQSVDWATNHITGQSYDANGNQTSGPLGTVGYDAENRIASVSAAGVQYAYDSRNKRIWRSTLTNGNLTQEFYFYGVDGQKLGKYALILAAAPVGPGVEMTDSSTSLAVFFGGKRLGTIDRLGTAKFNGNGQQQSFYPYGEDRGTIQPNDSLKFATYTRDTATGLDYADQRYYANNFGRFMSPDPYRASSGPSDPQSWNRYAYVEGDPVNSHDPRGLALFPVLFGGGGAAPGSIGGGGCGAVLIVAADPESGAPAGIECLFQTFGMTYYGGGGGQTGAATLKDTLMESVKTNMNTNCGTVLKTWLQEQGIGTSLETIADNTTLYNAQVSGNVRISSLPGAATNNNWGYPTTETIGQYVALVTSTVGAFSGAVLGTTIIVNNPQNIYDTLWHDFWHVATDLDDTQLVHEFIDSKFKGTIGEASALFDSYLRKGCK